MMINTSLQAFASPQPPHRLFSVISKIDPWKNKQFFQSSPTSLGMIYKFPLIYFCRLTVVAMKAPRFTSGVVWCGVAPSVNHNGCDVAAVMLPRAEHHIVSRS